MSAHTARGSNSFLGGEVTFDCTSVVPQYLPDQEACVWRAFDTLSGVGSWQGLILSSDCLPMSADVARFDD